MSQTVLPNVIPEISASEILQALERLHADRQQWAFFTELSPATGYSPERGAGQAFDAWALNLWPMNHLKAVVYEIKVSRSDYLREIKKPKKRFWALRYSNEFYFVTPLGLIRKEELPVEAGLMELHDGRIKVIVPAPYREKNPPLWSFMAAVCRRASDLAHGTRR